MILSLTIAAQLVLATAPPAPTPPEGDQAMCQDQKSGSLAACPGSKPHGKLPQTPEEFQQFLKEVAAKKGLPAPLSDADRVGQQAVTARFPPYPHGLAPAQPMADTIEANGMPMNIQLFETHDDPHQVMDFYRGVFNSWHMPLKGNGDISNSMTYPSITAFDDFNGVDIIAIAIPDPEAKITLVINALSDIRGYEKHIGEAKALKYGGLPEYPRGLAPSALTSQDGDRKMITVLFKTPDPVDDVVEYYDAQMKKAGYESRAQPGTNPSYRAVDYSNSRQVWHFMASASPEGRGTSVMATWQAGPAPAEDGP